MMEEYQSLSHTRWDCKYHVHMGSAYIRNQEEEDERHDQMKLAME